MYVKKSLQLIDASGHCNEWVWKVFANTQEVTFELRGDSMVMHRGPDLEPTITPGDLMLGFHINGNSISRVGITMGGTTGWAREISPPTSEVSIDKPGGIRWPLYMLVYHDVELEIKATPNSHVEIEIFYEIHTNRDSTGIFSSGFDGEATRYREISICSGIGGFNL